MTIRRPYAGSKPIGREIQFNNPLRNSNKKHFWDEGSGNLGFLTTEQIQILNQLKQRQKRARLYTYKNSNTLHKSINNLRYSTKDIKASDFNDLNQLEKNKSPMLIENKQLRNSKATFKKRIKSELKDYDNKAQNNQSKLRNQTISHETNQENQKPQGHKRVKTMQLEQNPEEEVYERFERNGSRKSKIERNHMQSGNIQLSYSPKSTIRQQESMQNLRNKNYIKIQGQLNTIQSLQDKNEFISSKYYNNLDNLQRNLLKKPEVLYRSKKFFEPKTFAKNKFRRDHSPTYCNSFQYPLSYFRHI